MVFFQLYRKFTCWVFLAFVAFTVIGTLTHELGHIAVARLLGYETELYYGSMSYYPKGYTEDESVIQRQELSKPYWEVPYEEWPQEVKDQIEVLYQQIEAKYEWKNTIWVTLGGPLQTLLTAFIGLWIVWWRHSKSRYTFRFLDWIGVFLALFALREVFNTVSAIVEVFLFGARGFGGDEFRISLSLGFNQWVIPLLTAALGCLISCYVLFKVLPLRYRFSFIVGGFLGGLVGFATWFGFLGPWLFNLKN